MSTKKWIAYGVTGLVGLGVVAGGAAATASTMDLHTTEGTVVPGGAVTNRGNVLDTATVQLQQTNSSVTVVTAPSAATVPTPATAVTPQTAPSPTTAPSPKTPPSPATPPSPVTPPSAASPTTPASAASAPSR
ncbi:hypothetical protein [Microbacterium tumbae]